eukprot:scaffold83_cov246-Pinguiococcus_pyrenoidosus.AAC.25
MINYIRKEGNSEVERKRPSSSRALLRFRRVCSLHRRLSQQLDTVVHDASWWPPFSSSPRASAPPAASASAGQARFVRRAARAAPSPGGEAPSSGSGMCERKASYGAPCGRAAP